MFAARSWISILIFPAALGPGVYSASNRNEYQKQKNNVSGVGGGKARSVRRTDNLNAICESIVYTMWDL
jgi:hypothetical protein